MKQAFSKFIYIFTLVLMASCSPQASDSTVSLTEGERMSRIKLDFSRTEEDVRQYIRKYIPDVADEHIRQWEESKALEYMVIDGEKRYFRNAAPNLFRVDSLAHAIKTAKDGFSLSDSEKVNQKHIPEVINEARKTDRDTVLPQRFRVTYTLTVSPNVVPEGETIRCWLPYPRTDQYRQNNVKLITTGEKEYTIAPESYRHSTLYMEKKAVKDQPTVFTEQFEYTSYAAFHRLTPEMIQPYDTASALYKEYTAERETHIRFSSRIRRLADSLAGNETNPLLKARRFFTWVNDNFPWASAREYSTIENIPEYVIDNKHGACGQVTLLFLTLCRYSGIPAHFQSGFMMHPGAWNLHDWGEIYFQGIGWVPVDQSFGIPLFAGNEDERLFFVGGIDAWRMIVNSDYSASLYPKKKYPRSETVDFQRGEVEWKGGNLYFDNWSYDMDMEYLCVN
jgi:transglutaminase-like putative cysteine protease